MAPYNLPNWLNCYCLNHTISLLSLNSTHVSHNSIHWWKSTKNIQTIHESNDNIFWFSMESICYVWSESNLVEKEVTFTNVYSNGTISKILCEIKITWHNTFEAGFCWYWRSYNCRHKFSLCVFCFAPSWNNLEL